MSTYTCAFVMCHLRLLATCLKVSCETNFCFFSGVHARAFRKTERCATIAEKGHRLDICWASSPKVVSVLVSLRYAIILLAAATIRFKAGN